jgi:hypothetical protein
MDDYYVRAALVHDHVKALKRQAGGIRDPDRLRAIGDEMEVCVQSLQAIRAEQISHYAELAKGPLRSRWWQFWRRTA